MEAVGAGKFQGLEKLITKKIDLEHVVKEGILSLVNEKDTQSECFCPFARSGPGSPSYRSQDSCQSSQVEVNVTIRNEPSRYLCNCIRELSSRTICSRNMHTRMNEWRQSPSQGQRKMSVCGCYGG